MTATKPRERAQSIEIIAEQQLIINGQTFDYDEGEGLIYGHENGQPYVRVQLLPDDLRIVGAFD